MADREDGLAGARRRARHAGTFARRSCEQVLGPLDRRRGVGGVAVGADRVGVLLGDGRAADHDDDLVAQAGLLERVHVGLEHRHRRGEERREADDVGLVLLDRLDELLRRHLHAEVDHLEAGALEHDVDEVLADVVDVALDGAHQELADRLDAGLGEQRAQPLHRAGHRAAGDQHLGHEEVAALEPRADLLQRRDERVEEQRLRLHAERQALLGQLEDARGVADQRLVVQALAGSLRGGHATPSFGAGLGRPRSSAEQLRGVVRQVGRARRAGPRVVGWVRRRPARRRRRRGPRTGTAMPVRPTSSSSTRDRPAAPAGCASRRAQRVAVGDGVGR